MQPKSRAGRKGNQNQYLGTKYILGYSNNGNYLDYVLRRLWPNRPGSDNIEACRLAGWRDGDSFVITR